MKRFALLMLVVLCLGLPAFAQDVPKAEVFGGFSLLHLSAGGELKPKGWQASGAYNFHKAVGIVLDTGAQYQIESGFRQHVYEYLIGPRYNIRQDNVTYFIDTFAGGLYFSAKDKSTPPNKFHENDFLLAIGGGVDVKAGPVKIRVFQFDWLPARSFAKKTAAGTVIERARWDKGVSRWGFGVVYPFGKK